MVEREKLVSLVQALQRGDQDAAGQLYDTFYSDIYYYIMKTVNDPELAADLTQDTFIEILETIGSLREPAAFVTWSRQVAYHRCTAHFRKRREILADEDLDGYSVFDTMEEDRTEFIPDAALDQAELKQAIHEMIGKLPMEQRNAILMRYFEERSVSEIARIQGVSEGTVKSRLNYGRKMIKQSVEDYERKSGVKLHCVGVIPLLLWLFRQQKVAQGVSLTAAASTGTAAVAGSTVAAGSAAAGVAVKATAGGVLTKVIAGVAAAAVVAGGTVAVVLSDPKTPEPTPPAHVQTQPTGPEDPTLPSADPVRPTDPPAPTDPQTPTDPPAPPVEYRMEWVGYGQDATRLHNRRFELTVGEMSDTNIWGELKVTLLYEVSHQSFFSGTGTLQDDGTVRYDIVFESPAVMGTIPTYEYYEMPLTYDPQTQTLTFDDHYYARLERLLAEPEEVILVQDAIWSGDGENILCWPKPDGHYFTVWVEKMTETDILGHIQVYDSDGLEHESDFTGRGFRDEDTMLYEVKLLSPHYANDMWNSVEEIFWMRYIPGDEILRMDSYYEFSISRGEPVSQGLNFTLNADGLGYTVSSLGSCMDAVLVIPASYNGLPVTGIQENAFFSCGQIEEVILPDTMTEIGAYAFQLCYNLNRAHIPQGVTQLPVALFNACALTQIRLHGGITYLGQALFAACHDLTDIYYDGTMEQWHAIEKHVSWNDDTPAMTIHCTNGEIFLESSLVS